MQQSVVSLPSEEGMRSQLVRSRRRWKLIRNSVFQWGENLQFVVVDMR